MKKLSFSVGAMLGLNFLVVKQALAVCPVCTLAVAAGVGLSRYLGVDDTVSGVWIGGLTVSMIMWTIDWCDRKKWHFPFRASSITVAYYLLIVAPLYSMGIMGHPLNQLPLFGFGIDKLLVGIVVGSAAFWFSAAWYLEIKARNGGRAHFPFQKVAIPVGMLVLMSAVFYFLTK